MRLHEIESSDNTIWRVGHECDFYASYELLKRQHMMLSADYDKSTSTIVIDANLDALAKIQETIKEMYKFCKNSHKDTETENFLQSLKLMYNDCEIMIKELNKYL